MGLTVLLVTPGRTGVGVRRRGIVRSPVGDEEGFAVGAETRGLAGDIAGGRRVPRVLRVPRVRRVRLGRVNGFGGFGLGVQDGFVW